MIIPSPLLDRATVALTALRRERLPRLRLSLLELGSYPIYRREFSYWDKRVGGRWRLAETFGLLTLTSVCLFPAAIIIYPAALIAYALLDEALWLAAVIAGSALIVREREALTWSALRATPIRSAQVAAGKLAGLLYQVWDGATYLVRARWIGSLLVAPLLALMLTLPEPFPFAGGWQAGVTTVGLAIAYLLFVLRPLANLISGGTLGLALSTVSRSTSGALVLAMLVGGSLTLCLAGLFWWSPWGLRYGDLFSESVLAGRLQLIFYWLLPLGAVTLARLLAAPLLFGLAAWKMERLSE